MKVEIQTSDSTLTSNEQSAYKAFTETFEQNSRNSPHTFILNLHCII